MRDIVLTQSEYESLLEEIHRLQARISQLTALRDDLLYHVCPALRAVYEEKIASLERELMAAEMYLRENQRVLEILQAQMNRQQEPSYEEAKKEAREEFREYEEELKRKAKEAEDFRNHWEKDTQWSEHDRKEKEEQKKNSGGGSGNEGSAGGSGNGGSSGGEDSGNGSGEKDNGNGSGESGDHSDGKDDGNDNGGKNKNGEGDSGDEFDYDDGSDDSNEGNGGSGNQDSTVKKLKRLYRKIVKRLHPDVNPNTTPHEKELLNQAAEAMRTGNLEMMERIWDELCGMDAPEDTFADTPEGIAQLKELLRKLMARMHALELEIRHIRSQYPYNMKSFLEDEEAVEERRKELQDKLKNLREANEKLVEFIRQVKQQMGM